MALRCDNCGRGREVGHNVSHAKNRTRRLFKPNLQKLRVLKDGITVRVKFCTSCIQKLKKEGSIGLFQSISYAKVALIPTAAATVQSKKHIDRDAKKIEEIMKKEEEKWEKVAKEEKVAEEKKKKEAIKIEELVGKK